jgi:hypothetical protein
MDPACEDLQAMRLRAARRRKQPCCGPFETITNGLGGASYARGESVMRPFPPAQPASRFAIEARTNGGLGFSPYHLAESKSGWGGRTKATAGCFGVTAQINFAQRPDLPTLRPTATRRCRQPILRAPLCRLAQDCKGAFRRRQVDLGRWLD